MKQLGYRLLNFIIPAIVFTLITIAFYFYSKINVKSDSIDVSKYKCLIMGDSQMQRINTTYFSDSTYNIASSAEHFYFTYQKLLRILEKKNNKVKKIVLGVAPHSFSPVYSRLFDVEVTEGKNSLKRYLYYLNRSTEAAFVKLSTLPFKETVIGVYRKPEWGGLVKSDKSNPDFLTVNRTFKMQYTVKGDEDKYSQSQKEYLHMIAKTCAANNIDLFICSTPYHTDYKEQIDGEYFDYFYRTIGELKNYHHIDFLSEVPPPNWMSDANHLNITGASYYSKRINEIIN